MSEKRESRWTGKRRLLQGLIVAAVTAVVAAGGYYGYTQFAARDAASSAAAGQGRGPGGGRPQPVSVAEVKVQDVPIWLTALGTATPRNLVTVRSRVDGELLRLHFQEGQMVKQAQLLAEIDPRPFQVQLLQAEGQMARDAALLANAQADWQRYKDLWAKDSIARQQLDTQEALVRQYQGAVEADRGQVEGARLQLSYARIAAPVSGRVGLRQVDPGNQVRASDALGLVVIAQLQPITVVFALPEAHLGAINVRLTQTEPVRVEAWDREQKKRLATGRLLSIDNLVDVATGTIKAKAIFRNEENELFPNQFVNVRVLAGTRSGALTVPSAAVLRGSKGTFVYGVDAQSAVSAVPVTLGPQDGEVVAVEGTLKPGQRIVTDGADKLREGAKVEVISAEARAAGARAGGDAKPKGERRGKRRADGAGADPKAEPGASAAKPEAGAGGERRRRPEGGPPPAAN